ncbi:MAG: SAF domain-containing protein [Micrococcales bacterium]|nr:SAF domain-containing protein [Micrococcales bacterium]
MAVRIETRVLRAAAWRWRWVGVVLLAALALRIAVPGVVQAFRQTSPVVVLAHQVEAGEELRAADVTVTPVANGLVPDGAFGSVDQVIGQRLTAALPAGLALVPPLLAKPGAVRDAPPGTVVVPVRLSDGEVAQVIQRGDKIDLLGSAGPTASGAVEPAQRLAQGAVVVGRPAAAGQLDTPGLVLLAVRPTEAELLSGAASWAVISAVLVG